MIDFDLEWQEAPGVTDAVLARTWCRLTIRVNGQSATRVVDKRTGGWRDGVFGSAFPLCCWLVDNLWFLLYEPYRWPTRYGSRDLARDNETRPWVQRHSLLAAREGGALPDLSLYADGDTVVAHWLRDGGDTSHPFLRFVGEGMARLEPDAVRDGVGRFVERILDRVADANHPDVDHLREDWIEWSEMTPEDRDLCAWSARLGLNAHYQDDMSDALAGLLRSQVPGMGAELAKDLLEVATADGVARDIEWLAEAHSIVQGAKSRGAEKALSGPWPVAKAQTAHETGYIHAATLREGTRCGSAPLKDLGGLMRRMGWADAPVLAMNSNPASPLVDAVVDFGRDGTPVIASHLEERASSQRFLLARSLFMRNQSKARERRLVTESHTWDQRASRAFAAELLAPADALSQRIRSSSVTATDVEALAAEFNVSSRVILHQIDNHGIAAVETSAFP